MVRIPKERPKCRKAVRELQAQGFSLVEIEAMDLFGNVSKQAKRMRMLSEEINDKMDEEVARWERLLNKKY